MITATSAAAAATDATTMRRLDRRRERPGITPLRAPTPSETTLVTVSSTVSPMASAVFAMLPISSRDAATGESSDGTLIDGTRTLGAWMVGIETDGNETGTTQLRWVRGERTGGAIPEVVTCQTTLGSGEDSPRR